MSGRTIGIDLGTTNSEVAAHTEDGVVVLSEGGSALFPSVVGVAPDGTMLVGEEALNQFILHPDRTVVSVKRLMGTEERASMAGKRYRPQEISAIILSALRDRAERVLGETVEAAVITVPAYFSDAQRQATREAGEIAGLRVERILNEPTAASLAYRPDGDSRDDGQTVLVYDLGGGTFDVSIVRMEAGVNEVLSSHGDTHLGGDDLNTVLLDLVARRVEDDRLRRAIRMEPRARARMLRAVEAARRTLSRSPYARIREDAVTVIDDVPLHVDLEITREEFEEVARPILEGTLTSIHRAMEDAGVSGKGLSAVLLAGGVTRTPLVSELIREATGMEPRRELQPDLCVALGAGLLAARSQGAVETRVLVDVTPYSFGPSHLEYLHGIPFPHAYLSLIKRGTPLPASTTESYFTTHDRQETVNIHVYQGEDPDARRNIEIGRFTVEGLAPVPEGNEILIRLDLDLDGILTVTGTEKSTGVARSVRIEGAVGRMRERELATAKSRVAELLGRDPREPAEEVTPAGEAPGELPAEAAALIRRYEALREGLHEDDKAEGDDLVARIRKSAAEGPTAIERSVRALEDLVFYAGEGA